MEPVFEGSASRPVRQLGTAVVALLVNGAVLLAQVAPPLNGETMDKAARLAAVGSDSRTTEAVESLVQSGYFRIKMFEVLKIVLAQENGSQPAGTITDQRAIEIGTKEMQKRYAGGRPDNVALRPFADGFMVDFTFRTPGNFSRTTYFVVQLNRSGAVVRTSESAP